MREKRNATRNPRATGMAASGYVPGVPGLGEYLDMSAKAARYIDKRIRFPRIEKAHYNPLDPDDEGLLERSRRGDRDEAEQMLIRSGIADELEGE